MILYSCSPNYVRHMSALNSSILPERTYLFWRTYLGLQLYETNVQTAKSPVLRCDSPLPPTPLLPDFKSESLLFVLRRTLLGLCDFPLSVAMLARIVTIKSATFAPLPTVGYFRSFRDYFAEQLQNLCTRQLLARTLAC